MAEYIDRQETIKKVCEGCNIMFDGEPCEPSDCFILKRLWAIPTADVVDVRPELRKVVKLLGENYERGLNSEYVRNPVAWALYQTWKQMDGGADNGERNL